MDFNQILTDDIKTAKYTLIGWPQNAPDKSKMADGRHLEKSNNQYIYATVSPTISAPVD